MCAHIQLTHAKRRGIEERKRHHDNRKCNSFNSHFGFLVFIQNTTYLSRLAFSRENDFGRWCIGSECRMAHTGTLKQEKPRIRKMKARATLFSRKC